MGVLALQVFLRKDATHPLGLMNRAGYSQSALVGGLLMFASTMSSCLGTHKFIASLLHEPKRAQSWAERWRELSGTMTN